MSKSCETFKLQCEILYDHIQNNNLKLPILVTLHTKRGIAKLEIKEILWKDKNHFCAKIDNKESIIIRFYHTLNENQKDAILNDLYHVKYRAIKQYIENYKNPPKLPNDIIIWGFKYYTDRMYCEVQINIDNDLNLREIILYEIN